MNTPPPGQPDPADLLALGLATEAGTAASSPPPASPDELAPEFPQLDILELLGRGGMGAVYKARQRDLDRIVALKILRPGLDADPGFAERFTREARALAQLNHPGIVTLYEFGKTSAGRYFILMEFVDGLNLRQLLAAGRLAPREALAIVPPLCDALQYAHDRGLIHRDIKPENILVDRLGRVKIADFGIAKLSSTSGSSGRSGERERPDSETIGHSAVGVGTPAYMAPEQRATPDQVDHRADLYALGVVLYQMLTGELPAAGQLRPPSTRVQLDVRLDEIVLRALEKDPALRYAAAREFKTHIETVAQTAPPAAALPGKPAPEPSVKSPSAWTGFGLLYCAYATLLVVTSDHLPDLAASHFDGDGRANGWMPRTAYLLFIALLPLAFGALFALSARSLRWLPPRYVNLPRRDHWLAPERRAATAALFSRWMAGPACLLLVFFAELHLATLLANRSTPPHLSTGLLIGPVIGFLVALMVWIVGLVFRFAEPDAPPAKSRRQSVALAAGALLALTLPAAPLLSHFSAASRVASVAPAKTETPPRFHFGRTREITLPRSHPVAYDFDRERFVDYAPTPQSPHGIGASQQWHAEHGTDVFADPNSYLPGVLFLGTDLAEVSPGLWDATADAAAAFSGQPGKGLMTFIPAPTAGQPPVTRVYRTPQGGIILVQLLGATDAGDVRLRYKAILPASTPDDDTKVVDQAHEWLRTVDQGDYAQSWLKASASLRRAITQEAWQTALQKARGSTPALSVTRRLETLQSTETLPGAADMHYFILRFDTLLDNDATCAETLTLVQEPEGDWRVAGYVIRPRTTAEKEVVAQAQSWLTDIDAGRFASSWSRASDSFHRAITNDQWCASLEAVRSPLGAVKIRLIDTTRTTAQLPGAPDGRYVVMTFNTAFEHKQTAVETVTFEQAKDGAWLASGYFIK